MTKTTRVMLVLLGAILGLWLPAAQAKTALLTVIDTNLSIHDQFLETRLTAAGYTVVVMTAAAATTADATGKDLILVSESAGSADTLAEYRDVTVPVVVEEAYILDDMKMTGATSGTDFGADTTNTIDSLNIIDAASPLAGGLPAGVTTIYTALGYMSYGATLGSGAIKIATFTADATKTAYFAYDVGSQMVGMTAPARRVGLFWHSLGGPLNTAGQSLLDAAISWAGQAVPAELTSFEAE
jgi:hypothetical protein